MNRRLTDHLGALRWKQVGQEGRHRERTRVERGNGVAASRQIDPRLRVDRAAVDDAMKRDVRGLLLDRNLSSNTRNNLLPNLESRRCKARLKLRILDRAVPVHGKVHRPLKRNGAFDCGYLIELNTPAVQLQFICPGLQAVASIG